MYFTATIGQLHGVLDTRQHDELTQRTLGSVLDQWLMLFHVMLVSGTHFSLINMIIACMRHDLY